MKEIIFINGKQQTIKRGSMGRFIPYMTDDQKKSLFIGIAAVLNIFWIGILVGILI